MGAAGVSVSEEGVDMTVVPCVQKTGHLFFQWISQDYE